MAAPAGWDSGPGTNQAVQLNMLLFNLLCFATLVVCQPCVWPDGKLAAGYQRCNETSAQCCFNTDPKHRDVCFDNGLCHSALWGGTYRGACSDPTWKPDSGCATQCNDGTCLSGWLVFMLLGNELDESNSFYYI